MLYSMNIETFNEISQVVCIGLSCGRIVLIDRKDLELVSQYKWRAVRKFNTWYAYAHFNDNGRYTTIQMHRLIMNAPSNLQVDHRDLNGLNNTRSNLRLATQSE